jgi:hypothetical protein
LFVETPPQSQDELSDINIISFQEPNEYFGLHDWVIQNKELFDIILTQSDKVLNNCDNAFYQPFGHTWLKPDQYNKDHVQFAQQQQQSHTDNIVGELVGRLMNKIENDVINRINKDLA